MCDSEVLDLVKDLIIEFFDIRPLLGFFFFVVMIPKKGFKSFG